MDSDGGVKLNLHGVIEFKKVCPLRVRFSKKICLKCPLPDYCIEEKTGKANPSDLDILEKYTLEKG